MILDFLGKFVEIRSSKKNQNQIPAMIFGVVSKSMINS
jgi:hypothetical protein